eukprot:GHVN01002401.1.p1 GENE.GHVN01002401.1~~GHVN01002401.1.p1  ORF type:complete len:529 (+),score=82.69 GHVN01002401.1:180-1766(+)
MRLSLNAVDGGSELQPMLTHDDYSTTSARSTLITNTGINTGINTGTNEINTLLPITTTNSEVIDSQPQTMPGSKRTKPDLSHVELWDMCYTFPSPALVDDEVMDRKSIATHLMNMCTYRRPLSSTTGRAAVIETPLSDSGGCCGAGGVSESERYRYKLSALAEDFGFSQFVNDDDIVRDFTRQEFQQLLVWPIFCKVLAGIGCQANAFKGSEGKLTFLKVRLREGVCRHLADENEYPLQMDKQVSVVFKNEPDFIPPYYNYEEQSEATYTGTRVDAHYGNDDGRMTPVEETRRNGFGAYHKLGYVWARYDALGRYVDVGDPLIASKTSLSVVRRGNHELSIFRDVDRCRLLKTELNHYLNVDYLRSQKFILSDFALHQLPVLRVLNEEWASFSKCDTSQDIELVRNYFGEAMAYYFAYLQCYTDLLMWPGVIGFFLWLIEWIPMGSINNNLINCVYAFYISVWTSWFLETWNRREALHRFQWGMESDMPDRILAERPDFREEKYIPNPVNPHANRVKYFPWWKRVSGE